MFQIKFTPQGKKDLKKLPPEIQRFILNKLTFYAFSENPLQLAKPLVNLPPATHRFRVRKYRISFYIFHKTIFVERVQLRADAYRV